MIISITSLGLGIRSSAEGLGLYISLMFYYSLYVSVPFLVAVIKQPSKSNWREKGFILVHKFHIIVHLSIEVKMAGTRENQSQSRPREEYVFASAWLTFSSVSRFWIPYGEKWCCPQWMGPPMFIINVIKKNPAQTFLKAHLMCHVTNITWQLWHTLGMR